MAKKVKKGKKKGKKGGKKKTKKTEETEVKKELTPKIKIIPDGNDWLVLSFCLVPWEAKLITLFLNFDVLINTRIIFSGLKRILQEKIGKISDVQFYMDPPNKDKPLNNDELNNLTLKELGFKGNIYTEPPRSMIFFDFKASNLNNKKQIKSHHILSPHNPHNTYNTTNNIDPLLLVEPSQIFLNRSETIKDETKSLVNEIKNKQNN